MKNWSWKQFILPAILLVAFAVNQWSLQPPTAKPETAPETEFSAGRAMEYVRAIATEPHPVGTAANERVRNYLLDELRSLGLAPEVQSTQILNDYSKGSRRHSAAYVHNVIARMQGTGQQGKALLLMSHYDSVYYGPGAGDDASGTATMLETIRALKAGTPLQNDVIFLFTDAEEVGLFGAQAFFSKHRWRDEIGLVLNVEARGSKGPVNMFQTSDPNNELISVFAETVERPLTNSLTVSIYKAMPNDTDMSISLKHGIPGMNFAFIDGFYDYHTKGDSVENLSQDTLQHMGDQALAMTRAMGNKPLPLADSSESVFFDVLTLFVVSYPLWGSWVVLGIAVVLLSMLAKGKLTSGTIGIAGTVKAFLGIFIMLVWLALIIDLLFLLVGGRSGDMVEGRRLFALADEQLLAYTLLGLAFSLTWFRMLLRGFGFGWCLAGGALTLVLLLLAPGWIPAAIIAATTALMWFLFQNPVSANERLLAGLDLYLLAAIAVQFTAPAGSHLFLWPLVIFLIGLLLYERGKADPVFLAVLGIPAGLWLLFFTEMGYSALGISMPGIIAVPYGLLLILLAPALMQATGNAHREVSAVAAALGLLLVGYTALSEGFTERLNRPTEVLYLVDSKGDGVNHFASSLKTLDPWAQSLMQGSLEDVPIGKVIPGRDGSFKLASAPQITIKKPLVRDEEHTGDVVRFTMQPGQKGHVMIASFTSTAPIKALSLNGEALDTRGRDTLTLYYFATPETGLPIALETTGELSLHMTELSAEWPEEIAGTIPPKPSTIMMAPYRFSDSTLAFAEHTFNANTDER